MKNIIRFILLNFIFSFFLSSCILNKDTTNTVNNKRAKTIKTTIGNIEVKDLFLARENCSQESFSFCDWGFDNIIRSYPILVKLNNNNFLKSYDTPIFLFPPPYIIDTLKKKYKICCTMEFK